MKIKVRRKDLSFNILFFLFLLASILKLYNNIIQLSILLLGLFLFLLLKSNANVKNNIKKCILDNRLLVFAYCISVFTSIYGVLFGKITFGALLEVVIFGIITVIGMFLINIYGESYLIIGSKQISFFLTILSCFGLIEYISGSNIFVNLGIMSDEFLNTGRIASLYIHPIVFGNVLLFALFTIVFLYKKSFFKYFSLFFILTNILLTQSRSSWCGVLAILLIYFFRIVRKRNIKINKNFMFGMIIFTFVGVIIVLNTSAQKIVFNRVTEITSLFNAKYQRTGTILYIINSIKQSSLFTILVGKGNHASSSFMLQTVISWENFKTTDNLYLANIFDFGIIYFFITIFYFLKMIKRLIFAKDSFVLLVLSILVSFEVVFFFYEPFNYYPILILFFLFIGIFMNYNTKRKIK